MSRIDKTNPKVGSYRATLAAALPQHLVEQLVAVGHDANGRIEFGDGTSGITGVVCQTKVCPAGKRIDVHTDGEVVEFGPNDHTATADAGTAEPGVDLGDPGKAYYGHADGTVDDTVGEDGVYIGHTVDNGSRLILRLRPGIPVDVTP
jgi:hypothetical protein